MVLLCLVRRWYVAAAVALGIGFALKVTPVALLPLVLLLAGRPRRWIWPVAGFAGAAFAGFLPYLFVAPQGIWYVFQYHIERPLQIESVLGTPMLLGQALGADWAQVGYSHGSWQLIAPGADIAADLSGVLTFGALVIVYVVLLARRARLRAAPDELPLAVLTVLLALMAFSKVLSPQFFIWLLPVLALVAARDWLLGLLGGVALLLTQVEYPALYGDLLDLEAPVLALVAARNLLLVALFCVTVWRLARPPWRPQPGYRPATQDPGGDSQHDAPVQSRDRGTTSRGAGACLCPSHRGRTACLSLTSFAPTTSTRPGGSSRRADRLLAALPPGLRLRQDLQRATGRHRAQ